MSEPVTIKLSNPIEFGERLIESLTVRPLKGKDLRRLKTGADRPFAMTLELAGYLTGEVSQVIDELQGDDLNRLISVVELFFGGSPEIGSER